MSYDPEYDINKCPRCGGVMKAVQHFYFDDIKDDFYFIISCTGCDYDGEGTDWTLEAIKELGVKEIEYKV